MDMTNITPVNTEDKNKNTSTNIENNLRDCKHFFEALRSLFLVKSKVKLVSSDGKSFTLDYDCVIQSGTIKELLESNPSKHDLYLILFNMLIDWLENKTGVIEFPCIE